MSVYGEIAERAYQLVTSSRMSPPDAWREALVERYADPEKLRNAIKHTCPRGVFLGLCQAGMLLDISGGRYTNSVSGKYALAALELLRCDPSLARDKSRLEVLVFGDRTPNDEVNVVLALRKKGLLRQKNDGH